MIPKIIHYCWFGKNPKPRLANKCIKSWEKYCKDYKIIEWNEDNFDISTAPLYVRQAYDSKKWAFVTDYVRLWAMITYGGIYMDIDVEVIKPLDEFLSNQAFSGFESETSIPTGIMASEKDFPLFKELLEEYENLSFIQDDDSFDLTPNVERITSKCLKYGLIQNNTLQTVNGFTLFPKDFFCPLDWDLRKMNKTDNTFTIHWFSASWWDEEQRKMAKNKRIKIKIKKIIIFILGEDLFIKIKNVLKGNKEK